MSSVELHQRDALEYLEYDLSDPLDLAIWTALQTYVAYLETASLEAAAEEPDGTSPERSTIYDASGVESLTVRPPGELEDCMVRLRDSEVGETARMGEEEILYRAHGTGRPLSTDLGLLWAVLGIRGRCISDTEECVGCR